MIWGHFVLAVRLIIKRMYNAAEKSLLNHIFDSIIYLGVSASQSQIMLQVPINDLQATRTIMSKENTRWY